MRRFLNLQCISVLALLCFVPAMWPAASQAAPVGIGISITVAPPVLPVYSQPPCPEDGYIWTPGYWAWGPDGYYWVAGAWVAPPDPGLLWTPGYWGFNNGVYVWNVGYWGPTVGFYGGIDYGFGYPGVGFYGGRWTNGHFFYNTAVVHVNRTVIRNVYVDRNGIGRNNNHVSFNGRGGITARPTAQEQAAMRGRRVQPTSEQMSRQTTASRDHNALASVNHGRPNNATAARVNARPVNPQQQRNEQRTEQQQTRNQEHVQQQQQRNEQHSQQQEMKQQQQQKNTQRQEQQRQTHVERPTQSRPAQSKPETRQAQPQHNESHQQAKPEEHKEDNNH